MVVIEFRRLTMHEAEEALAEMWNCLEEYDIPSPRMAFDFAGDERVSMDVFMDESIWADIMMLRLSNCAATEKSVQDHRNWSMRAPSCRRISVRGAVRQEMQLASVPSSRYLAHGGQRKIVRRPKLR
jgi:hypothetical protein